jgi:hypothetical protein
MQFYPQNAAVPKELRTEEFHIRPLRVNDVEIDYAAVMDSKSMLRIMSQSTWPSDDFTLEMNRKDLEDCSGSNRTHLLRVCVYPPPKGRPDERRPCG